MKKFIPFAALLAALALLPLPPLSSAHDLHGRPLTVADQKTARIATRLAAHNLHEALRWLQQDARIPTDLGKDGKSIDVHYRDGAELLILPPVKDTPPAVPPIMQRDTAPQQQAGPTPASSRAVVLEPFADELQLTDAGQAEADALTQARFQVDRLLNTDVTIPVLENLARYSVVYFQTHSNVDDQGNAIVTVNETDSAKYAQLFRDGSLKQATVAGDPHFNLYLAITEQFVLHHMGDFPNSALVFINGCALRNSPSFWSALQTRNVATLIGWDNNVGLSINEQAGAFVMQHLAEGETVSAALNDAAQVNLTDSAADNGPTHLGYAGDGSDTFARAIAGAPVPTPTGTITPTATPTVTPQPTLTPTPKPLKKHRAKCKPGHHRVHGKCQRIKKKKHKS